MAGPPTKNFCVVENDLWSFNILLRDKVTQVPIDLTSATIRLDIRLSFTSAVLLAFSIGSGITVPTPVNGRALFVAVAALAPGQYVYDLQYNFGGSGPQTRLRGAVKVLEEVTQGA